MKIYLNKELKDGKPIQNQLTLWKSFSKREYFKASDPNGQFYLSARISKPGQLDS